MSQDRSPSGTSASYWAPFRVPVFRVVWAATLASNIATAMRELAAAWLMTSLAVSAVAVGMVKAAAALPMLLLALPAGVIADLVDRRRWNLGINTALAIVTAGIGAAVATDTLTPALLIAAIFITGVGSALLQPTQQSLTPLLVPREHLEGAVALNGMGLNLSRALGPALAGALVAAFGLAVAFFANALGYLALIAAFWWWKGAARQARAGARESFPGAMAAGLRYVRHAPVLKTVFLRLAAFVFVAAAYWTLLPVLVKRELGGPGLYGTMLACVGAGSVIVALTLPWLRARLAPEAVLRLGQGATAAVLALLALTPSAWLAGAVMVVAGMGWLAALTIANVATQNHLPEWMRGRGMAMYLMVFAGAMSAGSIAWGALADLLPLRWTLGCAALAGVAALMIGLVAPLPDQAPDLQPSQHWWPEPHVAHPVPGERGPVQVSIGYVIDPARAREFVAALDALSAERLRDGAYQWGVFCDVAEPQHYVEVFLLPTWEDYERLRARIPRADARLEQAVRGFHRGPGDPVVRHRVAPPRS